MSRLVRFQYGKDSISRTEGGLRLGERPKDIMNAPTAGGLRGNSVTSRTALAGASHGSDSPGEYKLKMKFIRSFVHFLYVIGANTHTECIK